MPYAPSTRPLGGHRAPIDPRSPRPDAHIKRSRCCPYPTPSAPPPLPLRAKRHGQVEPEASKRSTVVDKVDEDLRRLRRVQHLAAVQPRQDLSKRLWSDHIAAVVSLSAGVDVDTRRARRRRLVEHLAREWVRVRVRNVVDRKRNDVVSGNPPAFRTW